MTADAVLISGQNLGKVYRLYDKPQDRLKHSLLWRLGKSYGRDFWALRDVSFDVRRGETVGIVGRNGSGKSTLLQIVAGTLQPTLGEMQTRGRVSALLELGSGFNLEYTGRENILLNGAVLGFSEEGMRSRMEEIVQFAGIGQFIDQPVKTYSSGMHVRLAFAIATCVDPDILVVDEALAVGDAYFQQRCFRRMEAFKNAGKAILLVTHDANAVKSLCDRAIWLEQGQLRDDGEPARVISRYLAFAFGQPERATGASGSAVQPAVPPVPPAAPTAAPETTIPNINRRYGDGRAEILGIGVYDEEGHPIGTAFHDRQVQIRVSARFRERVAHPIVGYILRNGNGVDIASTNTDMEGCALPGGEPGTIFTVRFLVDLPTLAPGNYSLSTGVADGTYTDFTMCDLIDDIFALHVIATKTVFAQMRLPTHCVLESR